jgi:hypothetical protein
MKNTTITKSYRKRDREYTDVWFYMVLACLLFFLLSAQNMQAQLTGYGYKDAIKVQENSGKQKVNYQVLLTINTQALISASKMQANGADIRFAKNCNGSTLYPYWIESGINTTTTSVWVMIDTIPASGSRVIYMWYGNKTAAAAASFSSTFPNSFIDSTAGSQVVKGINNYSWFEIRSGSTVTVGPDSLLVINARRIIIAGTLNGNGAGYIGGASSSNGNGPGGGKAETSNAGLNGGGGGSYGDSGGRGSDPTGTPANQFGQPGSPYGTSNTDSINMGSSGAGGAVTGGAGGGGITLWGDVVDISGTINDDGSTGTLTGAFGGGAGGAGGGVRIKGNIVNFSGIITAVGGNGGSGGYGGGGGSGGRIKIFSDASIVNTGTEFVTGGYPGSSNPANVPGTQGKAGTTYQGTFSSKIPAYTFLPHVGLTASANPACQNTAVTFTAINTSGFNAFNFYVGTASKQNGAVTTYSNSMLKNGDTVKVLAKDVNSCMDTSNKVIMTINPAPAVKASTTNNLICQGNSTTLNATGATSYVWSSGATSSSTMVSPSSTTTYTVTGTDGLGCTNTDTVTISVQVCTSIQQVASSGSDFKSYPTFNGGIFTIEADFGDMKPVVIEMNNMLGQKVETIEDSRLGGYYKKEVNITGLPDGVYFLVLKTGSITQVQKIIKK